MKIKLIKFIDATIGRILCVILSPLARMAPRNGCIPVPNKILVIRPGGLGDFLLLLPLLYELRKSFPTSQIDVLAERRNRPAALLSENYSNLICYDSQPIMALKAICFGKYDVVIDSEQFHYFSAILSWLTRAKTRIGFDTIQFRSAFYSHPITYPMDGQEAENFLRLLIPLGSVSAEPDFENAISLSKIGAAKIPNKTKDAIIISPRGQDKYRAWSADKYVELIELLLNKYSQNIVLVGGAAEISMAEEIISKLPLNTRITSLVGKTSFSQLCRIILQAKLFIGMDSGVSILAAILNTKTVTIFGTTNDKKWGRHGANHLIARKNFACAPCYILGRYQVCQQVECLKALTAREVYQLANKLI